MNMDPVTQTVDGITPPPDQIPETEEQAAARVAAEQPEGQPPLPRDSDTNVEVKNGTPVLEGQTMVGDAGVEYTQPAEADLDADQEPPVL